jgi:hypothetical protein
LGAATQDQARTPDFVGSETSLHLDSITAIASSCTPFGLPIFSSSRTTSVEPALPSTCATESARPMARRPVQVSRPHSSIVSVSATMRLGLEPARSVSLGVT